MRTKQINLFHAQVSLMDSVLGFTGIVFLAMAAYKKKRVRQITLQTGNLTGEG